MPHFVPIQVECYAGCRSDEAPRGFTWDGRRCEIQEIVDRWYQGSRDPAIPVRDYFKVRVEGGLFILRLDRGSSHWYLREPE